MTSVEILIVEDDDDILGLLNYNLSRQGYRIETAGDGYEALEILGRRTPDLVILDLTLPDMDGLEICGRIRRERKTAHLPVLILTARGEDDEIVTGLESGADDYLAKPFSVAELIARVRALLRGRPKTPADEATVLALNGLRLNLTTYEVSYDGAPIRLTTREFRLLQLLAKRPGWTFSRKQIVGLIDDGGAVTTERSVDVLVAGVRKKLRDGGQMIETVRGTGYKLKG